MPSLHPPSPRSRLPAQLHHVLARCPRCRALRFSQQEQWRRRGREGVNRVQLYHGCAGKQGGRFSLSIQPAADPSDRHAALAVVDRTIQTLPSCSDCCGTMPRSTTKAAHRALPRVNRQTQSQKRDSPARPAVLLVVRQQRDFNPGPIAPPCVWVRRARVSQPLVHARHDMVGWRAVTGERADGSQRGAQEGRRRTG